MIMQLALTRVLGVMINDADIKIDDLNIDDIDGFVDHSDDDGDLSYVHDDGRASYQSTYPGGLGLSHSGPRLRTLQH